MVSSKPVVIEDDVFLGINVIVLPGVHIGKHAYIGAGAVVTSDIPSYSVAVGNPARVVTRWDFDKRQWTDTKGDPGAQPSID
ncbi:MAG: DapH/DapD/GlmU-related protein [Acidimicrobiales bacterium]